MICDVRLHMMKHTRRLMLSDRAAVLQINSDSLPGVRAIDAEEFERLMALPNRHLAIETEQNVVVGYAFAFTSSTAYDGDEFQEFRRKYPMPFTYIDQVAVQSKMRRMRLGIALYGAIEDEARNGGMYALCCEVNLAPPNPESMAFHQRSGFSISGELNTADGRTVVLMVKNLK